MIMSRSAFIVSVVVGAAVGFGGLSVSVFVAHDELAPSPEPRIIQPEIDEGHIADLVAAKLIAANDARISAEKAKHKKADCAFWGKRMEGCS